MNASTSSYSTSPNPKAPKALQDSASVSNQALHAGAAPSAPCYHLHEEPEDLRSPYSPLPRNSARSDFACSVCYNAKTKCNGQRPCDRCLRLGHSKVLLCVNNTRKKRIPRPNSKKRRKQHTTSETKESQQTQNFFVPHFPSGSQVPSRQLPSLVDGSLPFLNADVTAADFTPMRPLMSWPQQPQPQVTPTAIPSAAVTRPQPQPDAAVTSWTSITSALPNLLEGSSLHSTAPTLSSLIPSETEASSPMDDVLYLSKGLPLGCPVFPRLPPITSPSSSIFRFSDAGPADFLQTSYESEQGGILIDKIPELTRDEEVGVSELPQEVDSLF